MVAATAWALDTRPLDVVDARVVELGCGTGRHASRLIAEGARAYVGVDGSAGMLEIARARTRDARCTWELAGLEAVPELGEPFDVALLVLVLEHVVDLAPPFDAVARALRPGGVLRIVEIHPELVGAGTVAHFHDDQGAEIRFTSVAHPVDEVVGALEVAGLAIGRLDEQIADDALLARVPRLAKHRGRRVLLDVTARRSPARRGRARR